MLDLYIRDQVAQLDARWSRGELTTTQHTRALRELVEKHS